MSNTISRRLGCVAMRSHVPSVTVFSSFRGYGYEVEISHGSIAGRSG